MIIFAIVVFKQIISKIICILSNYLNMIMIITKILVEKNQENTPRRPSQIEFIESVFREWVKLNQMKLNNEFFTQNGVSRQEGDLDIFSLWLVDNIYLQVYCKGPIIK